MADVTGPKTFGEFNTEAWLEFVELVQDTKQLAARWLGAALWGTAG